MSEFRPAFKGCAIVPLTDDDDDEARIRYHGDWAIPAKRVRIKSKPRKYLLTFYLKGHNGERGVDEVKILDRANFIDLAEYIHLTGNEIISDIGVDRVNIKTSYVSIKA